MRDDNTTSIASTARRITWGFWALAWLASGCASSGTQNTPDESPTSEASASSSASSESETNDRGIPPLRELEFADEAPKAELLGQQESIRAYDVGGLTLLHKPTPANSVVSAKLYIDGGVANLSEGTSGIEKLALRTAVNGGTESTPKEAFQSTLSSMGSSIDSFNKRDYSGYSLRSTVDHFDGTWALFEEAVLEPAMPQKEVEIQREKQIADIQKISENPNRLVGHISRELIAEGHPYRFLHVGTEPNLQAFESNELKAYHHSLLDPERMVLAVVGDVPVRDVIDKVRARIGRLKGGGWTPPELPPFQVEDSAIESATKKIPTNYVLGKFPAPAPGSEDYPATRLALAYLSDQLFKEVRTKRNLSYAVASNLGQNRTNTGYLYVSAKQPNKTMKVIFEEVEQLKNTSLTPKQLKKTRNVFVTEYYMGLETNASQASALARAELLWGDWRAHLTFLERIRAVQPEDIRRVAETYLQDYQFGIVGQPDRIDRELFTKPSSAGKTSPPTSQDASADSGRTK